MLIYIYEIFDFLNYENLKFEISHIVSGDILPSVSSRDIRRQKANIWTSGNRIFHTTNPSLFLEYANKFILAEKDNSTEFKLTKEYLEYIIDIENNEYKNYLDWITYELEKRNNSPTSEKSKK